jgi:hypothetical protein
LIPVKKKKGFGISSSTNPSVRIPESSFRAQNQRVYQQTLHFPDIITPGKKNPGLLLDKENGSGIGIRQNSFTDALKKPRLKSLLKQSATPIVSNCIDNLGTLYAGKLGPGESLMSVASSLFECGGGLKIGPSRYKSGIDSPQFQTLKKSYVAARADKDYAAARGTLSHILSLYGGKSQLIIYTINITCIYISF